MFGALKKVLLILFWGVDVGEDPGIVYRHLEPIFKIATDHGSGAFGKALLQEFGKELAPKEHRVASATLESRDHQGSPLVSKPLDQASHRIGTEERVVHGCDQNRGRIVR
jgi:hypothetical protein